MGSGASNMFIENPMKKNYPPEDVPSFKIVLVGDSNVGKSSIFLRYTKEQFDYSYRPTVNVNIGNVTKKLPQPFETLVSITLWDLPGREEIDLRRSYYKDIDAAIVVVDLCDEGSIDMAGTWKQDIMNNSSYKASDERWRKKSVKSQRQLPILLMGNKLDKIPVNENSDELQNKKIDQLKEVATRHNFVGCVVVSACNSDGGVHETFRSLINYLLEKKMPKKVKVKSAERANLKAIFGDPTQHAKFAQNLLNVHDHSYQPLLMCKIPELDELFRKCDQQVESVENCCVAFLISVKNFKRSCCVCGLTDSYKATIEECITGMRDTLRNNAEEDVLVAHEEAGYIRLELRDSKNETPAPLQRVLQIYESEVCKTTSRVLSHCPPAKINLSDCLVSLRPLQESTSALMESMGFNKKQMKLSSEIIDDNISRVEETIELAREAMKVTDEQFQKIKGAMMW